jgi:hypothetical protein
MGMKKVPFMLVLIMMTASLAGCLGNDADSDTDSNDDSDDTSGPTWLATQTATNATSNNGTLILETQEDVFVFSDRPDRLWKHVNLLNFTALWSPNGTFNEDAPNAVLTWKSNNGSMAIAEVILTNAMWNNATGFIEYDYTFVTGDSLPPNISDVSLFIAGDSTAFPDLNNKFQFDDRDAADDLTATGGDTLVHVKMMQGASLNWALLEVSIVVDGGTMNNCVEATEADAEGLMCTYAYVDDKNWDVSEEITISEGANADLCDGVAGFCEVEVILSKKAVGDADGGVIGLMTATAA